MPTLPVTLFTGLLLLPLPDIIPDGTRGIVVAATFDAKGLARTHCLAYVVAAGDTLTSIARVRCGGAGQVAAIERLNPNVAPDKLRIGDVLWLPPLDAEAAKRPVFAFLDSGPEFARRCRPLVDGAAFEPPRYGMLSLFLVPQAELDGFRALVDGTARKDRPHDGRAWQEDAKALAKLIADKRIVAVECQVPGRLVDGGDPTHKRVDTISVEAGADGKFTLSVRSVRHDKDGKVIEAVPTKAEPAKEALLWLLLAASGGAFLWHRARRAPVFVPA